jgi:hypothetical protein
MIGTGQSLPLDVVGFGFLIVGAGMLWVRYAHERHNFLAEAIYSMYEKVQLVKFAVDTYLLVGGIGGIVLGVLFLAGWIG